MFCAFTSLLPILGLVCPSSSAAAAEQKTLNKHGNNPLHGEFTRIVNQTLDIWHVPGMSIGVVDGDDMWAEVSDLLNPLCTYYS